MRNKLIALLLLLCAAVASADYTPTHYVTADADGTGDGSLSDPWTLAQAVANATAGNVVRVAPGVYTGSLSGDRWAPSFGVRNDGTAANPIIIYAQYPASQYYDDPNFASLRSELRNGGVAGSTEDPVIGTWGFDDGTKYVTVDGFYVNGASGYAPFDPSGGAVMVSARGHFTVRNFAFDMVHYSDGDNYVAIFMQPNGEVSPTGPLTIENCLFVGGAGSGNHNAAAITTYYTQQFVIQNNEFRNTNQGIYVKGANNGGIIRYNLFADGSNSAIELNSIGAGLEVEVYQNLIIDPAAAGIWYGNSPPGERRGGVVYNNTIVADDPTSGWVMLGGYQDYTDQELFNNLMVALSSNSQVFVNAWESTGYTSLTGFSPFDYNVYYNNGSSGSWAINGSIYSTLSAWQTASSRDANSQLTDPDFVDAANGDYRLDTGSAALTASTTGGPVGAYITGSEVIGIDDGESDTAAPVTTISTSDPSAISADSLTITGSASDAVGVSGCKWRLLVEPDANNGTACTGTTSFSCATSGYSQGANTAYVGCYDAAGNYGSDSITVNLDSEAPVLSSLLPTSGSQVAATSSSVTLGVTTDENATCAHGRSGTAFGSMTEYGTTGGTTHTTSFPVVTGGVYWECSRCEDTLGAISDESCTVWSVAPDHQEAPW